MIAWIGFFQEKDFTLTRDTDSAEVWIEAESRGIAPIEIDSPCQGNRAAIIRKEGYEDAYSVPNYRITTVPLVLYPVVAAAVGFPSLFLHALCPTYYGDGCGAVFLGVALGFKSFIADQVSSGLRRRGEYFLPCNTSKL